jgi:ATP-dependent RNA helicase SUPV3L1/SUV3
MLRFSSATPPNTPEAPTVNQPSAKTPEAHPLDAITGGAFSAPTSGERTARVRQWLAGNPGVEQMNEVFKELSARDKGAARPLREKLDELKRAKGQENLAGEWAERGQALLTLAKLNLADALAWQRDAAKAGAPLSKEPLASLKVQLSERVKIIEDLQHRAQVQREAAVLLAQRIEVLSTKPWRDAQTAWETLRADVANWQTQAESLAADANWPSVDAKFPPLLDASKAQLLLVWEAFQGALSLAVAAADDAAAPLPPVSVWADELRVARGVAVEVPARPQKPKVDPEVRAKAVQTVREVLTKLEQEIAEGHGKASAGAASALRNALKENGKLIDDKLENQAHAALAAAGELEGWQRWRADQLREELVAKAEGLLGRPEGQALGGRKMQETLRALRDQWKQTDQGGVPNHAMWKRFDDACNEAYKVVEAWLEKIKSEAAETRTQRLALIEELKAWTERVAQRTEPHEWKAFSRALYGFGDRWRDAGHLGEKAFAELQPLWKEAMNAAAAPLENEQKLSLARRHAMIDEARVLGEAPMLHIDAVKSLQQRWQAEAQTVPLDRKHEQKLWDAFRKPIDDAFNRKTAEREQASASLGERDRTVLDAAKALEAANGTGDAQKIRAAMAALDAALRGQAQAAAVVAANKAEVAEEKSVMQEGAPAGDAAAEASPDEAKLADAAPAGDAQAEAAEAAASGDADAAGADAAPAADAGEATPAPAPVAAPVPPKRVVAVRGDDRPGMRKSAPAAPAGRGGKFGDRKGPPGAGGPGARGASRPGDNKFEPFRPEREERGGGRFGDRPAFEDRGPRLGDQAFRAQRDALEHAEMALRKLAAQAHGEALTQLLTAWEKRSADQVPGQQDLGRVVSPAVRTSWVQALGNAPAGDAAVSLLRLEMASDVPTPAEHISARRMLQLQLLTRRNDPTPEQTWGQDVAKVLASDFDAGTARRVQTVLKVLLKK